jgi:hypothetical protein
LKYNLYRVIIVSQGSDTIITRRAIIMKMYLGGKPFFLNTESVKEAIENVMIDGDFDTMYTTLDGSTKVYIYKDSEDQKIYVFPMSVVVDLEGTEKDGDGKKRAESNC